jgi:hypothetical protein
VQPFIGSVEWVGPIFLTATITSGCTAWVLCALLFLWSNIAEPKRIQKLLSSKIERLIFRDVGIVHAMIGLRRDGITL